MRLLFVSVLAILVNCVFCAISRGDDFLELNNASNTVYMVSKDCVKMYICKTYKEAEYFWNSDVLSDCYFRDKTETFEFKKGNIRNPDGCDIKGYIGIKSEKCYITSDGRGVINTNIKHPRARYYDIDNDNKRALTEFGWCTFDIENDINARWMNKLSDDLNLKEINIPGTHDSGTYAITSSFSTPNTRTQDLDITEQLFNGVRYLDIRLETNDEEKIYISHWKVDAHNTKTGSKYYYLKDIFDETIKFLHSNYRETVIIHLKEENIHVEEEEELYKRIGEMSILNDSIIFGKQYKSFFYTDDNHIPKLGKARGKIVLATRRKFAFNSTIDGTKEEIQLGIHIPIPEMGSCKEYDGRIYDESRCYPVISWGIRVQDDYKVNMENKCHILKDIFEQKIPSVSTNGTIYAPDSYETYQYYNRTNREVLTINFTNIDHIFSSIYPDAKSINDWLSYYIDRNSDKIYHEWINLDFPSPDIIRKIYQTNFKDEEDISNMFNIDGIKYFMDVPYFIVNVLKGLGNKRRSEYDEEEVKACLQRKFVMDEQGNQYEIVKTNYRCVNNMMNKWRIQPSDDGKFYSIISSYDGKCLYYSDDTFYMKECKTNNKYEDFTINNGKICARLDESKCLDGSFDITSIHLESAKYDHLTCSSTFVKLGYNCCYNQNAKVEKVDNYGNWAKENGEWCGIGYERCSFEVLGYHCCSSVNPKVVKEDSYGQWGEEDGELCGIGEMNRVINYRIRNIKTNECVLVNNTEDKLIALGECTTSNHSLWHIANVDEYNNKKIISVRNGKCLFAANTQTPGLEICDKVMDIRDRYMHFEIIENKYLCVKNSKNLKYHCLNRNSLNFEELSDKSDEYFQWKIQDIDEGVIVLKENDIYNPNRNNDPPKISPPSDSVDSDCPIDNYPCCSSGNTEIVYTDEEGNWGSENNEWCLIVDNSQDIINNTESECPYDGYPCCSSNNSKFYFSDESGIWGYKNTNWGYENGYCIINDDISKYTKVTSYDLCIFDFYGYPCCSSNVTEISMTDDSGTRWGEENGNYCGYYESKSDYKSYWFYHAESNKCLYAPENIFISDKVTLKTCDESDYSKWMTLESRTGFIYSVAYPNYCININSNDEITLGLCNNYAKISHTDSALFIPTLFEDKCIGLLNDDDINKDSISLRLNTCTNKLSDNFYVWNETDYKQNIMNLGKYNYCSSNISEIVFIDDVGNWGVENGEWCLIKDN